MAAKEGVHIRDAAVRINAIMDGTVDDAAPEDLEDEPEPVAAEASTRTDKPSVEGFLNSVMTLGDALAKIKDGKLDAGDVVVVDVSTMRFIYELTAGESR